MKKSLNANMDFLLYEKGETFLLNGITQRGLFLDAEKISQYDDIVLTSKISFETGSVIQYKSVTWLVVSQVQNNIDADTNIYRARIRRMNYSVKFNFHGNVKSFPSIIETKMFDIQSDQYVTMPVGKILVTLNKNSDSRDIILAQRFIIMGSAWKIVGIDRSVDGLIILNCDMTSFTQNDDQVDEIANRWEYEVTHTYELNFVGDTASLNVNDVISVSAIVTDNGTTMANPTLTYLSSDSNIVSVDNSGHTQGISLGTATIEVHLTGKPDVKDSIIITVQALPVSHLYSISISATPITIKLGQIGNYEATFYDNGSVVTDQAVTWSIVSPNPDSTVIAYATIVSSTGTSTVVKATSNTSWINKYFVLKCTLVSDPSISVSKQIQTKSLV